MSEALLAGLSAHLVLRLGVLAYFLVLLRLGGGGFEASPWLAAKPVLEACGALVLLGCWRSRPRGAAWPAAAVFSGGAVVLASHLTGPFGLQGWERMAKAMGPSLVAAGLVAALARRAPRRPSLPVVLAATLGLAAAFAAILTPESSTKVNALGLVCFGAGSVERYDYAQASNKDDYPASVFRYNSLGYRDEEPSAPLSDARRLILLVGDSYVWGDGIPTNEETLGSLLRSELERAAPRRYAVMSAGYPGLGLYGYDRIVSALQPLYHPSVVVVGYLGEADHDPLDAQFLADRLPAGRLARNLVIGLRVARQVAEGSVVFAGERWRSPRNAEYFAGLRGSLSRAAAERGYRLLFLSYPRHAPAAAAPAATLTLPEELLYPGHRNAFWYEKDFHPKPALNRLLAQRLASAVLAGEGASPR